MSVKYLHWQEGVREIWCMDHILYLYVVCHSIHSQHHDCSLSNGIDARFVGELDNLWSCVWGVRDVIAVYGHHVVGTSGVQHPSVAPGGHIRGYAGGGINVAMNMSALTTEASSSETVFKVAWLAWFFPVAFLLGQDCLKWPASLQFWQTAVFSHSA